MAMIRRGWEAPSSAPTLPPGYRILAIGDVHGRADLLVPLLDELRRYVREAAPARNLVLLLGDVIDRGPASAEIVSMLAAGIDWAGLLCLKGNHEAAMLAAIGGDRAASQMWLRHGGVEASASWGVDPALLGRGERDAIVDSIRRVLPADHLLWLSRLPVRLRLGGYLFVHAGIRPGVSLDRQTAADQLWIRDDFLASDADHGVCVVHGHSVSDMIDERSNRIGIDTGAYASNRLTTLILEGERRRYVACVGGRIEWDPPVLRAAA